MPKPKKPHRRARGTGTIFQRPDGTWVGRRTIAGRRVERKAGSLTELLAKLDAATPPDASCTVGQWAARWRQGWQVRPTTASNYRVALDLHILPRLGTLRLASLTPNRVETLANELAAAGLHANTARQVLGILGRLCRAAVREGLLAVNPVAAARKPRWVRTPVTPFTPAELAQILAACVTVRSAPLPLLAATGMRVGEVLGLDVTDYDPATGMLSISRTFSDRRLGPPKTPQGRRTIRVPLAARPALELARGTRTAGPMFLTSEGNRRKLTVLAAHWAWFLAGLEIPYRNLHQLRHTAATRLLAAGVPIPDLAKFLGDRPETVVRTYVHPSGVDPSLAMDALLGGSGEVEMKTPAG